MGKALGFTIFFLLLFSEKGSCHVAQPGFKLLILLPQLLECWDYRHAPHPGYTLLFIVTLESTPK
jgi:hypothetical protein